MNMRASSGLRAVILAVSAHEAVVLIDFAGDAHRAVAPGHRPAIAVPIRAENHVVAVVQGRDAIEAGSAVAHTVPRAGGAATITGVAANEAVVLIHLARNA